MAKALSTDLRRRVVDATAQGISCRQAAERLSEQASSTQDANDRSVIVIDAPTLKTDRAFAHFLMAHECCHHTLGHTRIASQSSRHLSLQPFYYIRPLLKNMELDADGWLSSSVKCNTPDPI